MGEGVGVCDTSRKQKRPPSRKAPSHQITRHPLDLRHVVVENCLLAAIVPFDGYASPILFSDGALIGLIVLPANAVADIEKSGLVAGHLCPPFIQTAPTSSRQPAKLFASVGEA